MPELNEIFEVTYGNKFDLNKMDQSNEEILFIGRSAKNNGVTANVAKVTDVEPYKEGLITVALGGSVLSSFVQYKPFYTGQNLAVLKPKIKMTLAHKLFYCVAIKSNAYRFSACGREANRTLKKLIVPALNDIPDWVFDEDLERYNGIKNSIVQTKFNTPIVDDFRSISELFFVENGIPVNGLKEYPRRFSGGVMFVRPASTHSRTLRSFISSQAVDPKNIYPAGTLFVSTNGEGSHTYSYVSTEDFVPNSDVSVLIPKNEMSLQLKLYYARCITANRYLFSYGRKPKGKRLTKIKLPFFPKSSIADVSNFINSLDYSSNLQG